TFSLSFLLCPSSSSFFFTEPPPSAISPLSLHDALPICGGPVTRLHLTATRFHADGPSQYGIGQCREVRAAARVGFGHESHQALRSEEHTSELQSQSNLVCRLLLEKKKK